MKKFLSLLLFSSIFILYAHGQVTNAVFRPKGKISGDNENTSSEADPRYTAVAIANPVNTKSKGNSNNKSLSQLEQGMNIVEDIVDELIGREYSFSLLSGHKYMINSCLGIKVSAGQFMLRFANPMISLSGGKFSVKLKVDKIKFSAFKIRSRPRAPDFSDPDPCHFSGKFEIGGEATDVSVRFTMDLIAIGSAATAGYCSLAFGEPVDIKWTIGGFNLRPMPNALDNLGKEMVEDALNNGMTDLVYNRLMDAAKAILPEYFDACEAPASLVKNASNISNPAPAGNENGKTISKTVTGLAEGMGRLNLDFPEGVEWDVDIYTAANKFITNRSSAGKHRSHPLAAGSYNIKLNTVPVEAVEIMAGKETRIRWGVLDINTQDPWEIRSEADKFLTSGNRPKKLALPVGRYFLVVEKARQTVVVTDEPDPGSEDEDLVPEDPQQKWTVKPGAAATMLGKIEFNFPEKAKWVMAIFNEASGEYVQTISESNNLSDLTLGPGKYKLVLNNVPVEGVPIEPGSATALKVGVLDVSGNASWTIWDESGKDHFKTENGAARLVFPIGKYVVKISGGAVNIEIKEGEVLTL